MEWMFALLMSLLPTAELTFISDEAAVPVKPGTSTEVTVADGGGTPPPRE
jgi:hypothetical protein